MKILYLNLDRGIPVLGDKGASVHVRSFITAAAALGHEIVLACTKCGEGNAPPPARLVVLERMPENEALVAEARRLELADNCLDDVVLRREISRLAQDKMVAADLCRALDEMGFVPDLVYERHALFHRAGIDVAARYGVARLLEVNAPLVEEQRKFRDLRLEDEARHVERLSYEGAEAIIAVSDAVAAHVVSVVGDAAKVHVVPNGVDLVRFGNDDGRGAALRAGLGLGTAPVMGFIGSFKPWHGVLFLLDVFAKLTARTPNLYFLAVGDGPEREAVRVRARELRLSARVMLPGRIAHEDIPAWLSAMTITVAPYLPQPDFYFSPMKIVESLAAGRPVVAPAIGQISRIVQHERTGVLYAPGNAVACGAAIESLVCKPQRLEVMAARARQAAGAHGWQDAVARILALAGAKAGQEFAA